MDVLLELHLHTVSIDGFKLKRRLIKINVR